MVGSGVKGWPCGVARVLSLAMALIVQHRVCHGEEGQQAAEASSEASMITTSPHVSHQDSVERAKSILGLTSFKEGDVTSDPIYASQDVWEILSSIKSELRAKHLVPKLLKSKQSYLGTIENPTSPSDASHINSKHKIFPSRLYPDAVITRETRTKVLKAQQPSSSKGLEHDSVSASPIFSEKERLVRVRLTPEVRREEPQVKESGETKSLPEVGDGDKQEDEERSEHKTTKNQDVEPTANLKISEKLLIFNEKETNTVEKEQTVNEKKPKVGEVDHIIDTKASNLGEKPLALDKEDHNVDEHEPKTNEREAKIDSKESIMNEIDAQKELKEPKRSASLYEKMAGLARFHQSEEGGQSEQPAGGDGTGGSGEGVEWVGKEKVDQERREKVDKVEEDKVHSEEEGKMNSKLEEEEEHKGEEEKVHKEVEVKLHKEKEEKVHMEEEKVHKEKEKVHEEKEEKVHEEKEKVHEEKEKVHEEKEKVHEEKEEKMYKKEEEQKVNQEEKCGSPDVQPVGKSLEVGKQFLNAIEGPNESLVNVSTIIPSRVLDDKSKFFTNQKPDTTLSHIINAKVFFSHFPVKNFTYVDEQGTSSLSDSTKPEDPGIDVLKFVQPQESISAVLEDDSTSHRVDSKQELEVENFRKIDGEVNSLDKVKEGQEKEREEQVGKEAIQTETKTDATIDSDTADKDRADIQEQESIEQPTADIKSTAEVNKLSPVDSQSKPLEEPEQLTIIGGEEAEIKEEEVQQVNDVTSKPEIDKEDISDSKRTNESTREEKVEPTGDEKEDVEAKETTEGPLTGPEEQTPSVPDNEGEEEDQPSQPTEESEKPKKKMNETEKAVKEETLAKVDRTPEGEIDKEAEKKSKTKVDKEVEEKEAEKKTEVDEEVEKKEAEKETEKKEPVKEDEQKESKDEESEKSADILETYSQFTQRVNAEKKNDIITNGHGNNGHGKGPKVKSKNYASPDCGSKILTANPEATHTSKCTACWEKSGGGQAIPECH